MLEGEIQYEVAKQNSMDNSWRDEWFYGVTEFAFTNYVGSIFLDKPEWIAKLKEGFGDNEPAARMVYLRVTCCHREQLWTKGYRLSDQKV